jgi:AAA+ superfamily predicted ATPase
VDEKDDHNTMVMSETVKINLPDLEDEIDWFAEVLQNQFHSYFSPEEKYPALEDLVPPDLHSDGRYAVVVRKLGLGYQERIALMLGLMPHLQPNLLDIFFTKNAHYDKHFTEFGGITGKQHLGFLPTGETLHFLLHQGALNKRLEVLQMLGYEQPLVQHNLLRLERTTLHEPALSGALVVPEEFIHYLATGQQSSAQASEIFSAQRVSTFLSWEDLVLDPAVLDEIELLRQWIENEQALRQCDAFRKHIKPGFRALFYGPPGTGKTLTACLLGKATERDVYRIDLSLTVSKYIGETEKNLSRVFDTAQNRNWILFFDEADALFGKRTQASSSNDRYANQEVSYLLQRVEDFPGIVILASNLKSNIDEAFVRRFQAMVYFPMPTAAQRLKLWTQFFSGSIRPHPSVDLDSIAEKYELSGGAAINVFRYCALRAAQRSSHVVLQDDILQGLHREFQKYGKTITNAL